MEPIDYLAKAKKTKPVEFAQLYALIDIAEQLRKFNEGQERSAARERNYY
jgi:hypothetical protein